MVHAHELFVWVQERPLPWTRSVTFWKDGLWKYLF